MLKYLHLHFAAIIFLLGSAGIQAQENIDSIYLLNGKEIEAKVGAIEGKFVLYTPYEQEDSPSLRIAKTEIDRVKMANGTEVWFNRLPKEAKPEAETAVPEADKERKKKRPVSAQKLQRQR